METKIHPVLELAENLSPEELLPTMKRNEARRTSTGLFHSAWTYVEYALNQRLDTTDSVRAWHMESAQYLLGKVINNYNTHQDTAVGALVLSTYLPIMRQRSVNEAISSMDVNSVYESLAAAMSHLRPLEIDEPPQHRMEEVTVLALSARTRQPDFLMFPTSPREEASKNQSFNHDGYFLYRGVKMPIQQKLTPGNKIYNPAITMMTLAPIFDKAAKKHFGETEPTLAGKLNTVITCIIAEVVSGDTSPEMQAYLNDLSEAVVAHYFEAAKIASVLSAA